MIHWTPGLLVTTGPQAWHLGQTKTAQKKPVIFMCFSKPWQSRSWWSSHWICLILGAVRQMEPYKKINESNFDFPSPLNRNGICSCSALSIKLSGLSRLWVSAVTTAVLVVLSGAYAQIHKLLLPKRDLCRRNSPVGYLPGSWGRACSRQQPWCPCWNHQPPGGGRNLSYFRVPKN